MRGDFGPSLRQRDFTVRELIGQGLPVSVTLGLAALVVALLLGIPAGIVAARRRGRGADLGIGAAAALAIALPSFVSGPLLVLIFALHLHWLPAGGWQADAPRFLVLPVLTLALPVAAYAGAADAREPARGAGARLTCAARARAAWARRACCGATRCARRCCRW